MISDLKPYAEYKESGLPWLGQVPGHWEVVPIAGVARLKSVVNQSDRQLLSVYLQRGVVRFLDIAEKRTNATSEDLSKYQAVDRGDFVLNNQQAWRGSVGVSNYSGIVSPAYLVLELSKRYLTKYANLLFRDHSMVSQYLVCSKGVGTIQRNLYWPHLKGVGVVVPPLPEQTAIVRFLDWANGRLDRAIRAKRKTIALLNEQKQAIIHRAVTRGIDPSVPLKDSGVPWLGEVPKHWKIVRNMALFAHRVEPGLVGLPVLQVSLRSGITAEELDQFGRPKRLIADPTKYKRIYKDDVAYNTMRMWQGAVGVSPSNGLVSPAYVVLRPRLGTYSNFYDFFFHTEVYKLQVNRQSTGIVSDRNRLYWDSFKQMPNVAVPHSEQERIVDLINSKTSGLNSAIFQLESEIELLREYRTRLTSDVVTGKLDVREAAKRLPAEAPVDFEEPIAEDSLDEMESEDAEE